MGVPTFDQLTVPLLRLAGDGQEHSLRDAIRQIGLQLNLGENDLRELLPSGAQTRFSNRVSWACTYLKKAGLLIPTRRGWFQISARGREVIARNPNTIDVAFLEQFPEFTSFTAVRDRADEPHSPTTESQSETPEELLEKSYSTLRKALSQDLLERVRGCSPEFFEKLVVELLVAMGYGGSRDDAGQAIGRSGDEGIDGIIKEDRLGLDAIYLQAKRWEAPVGRPVVQAFAGSLEGHRARKGVLITTSSFTRDAIEYVSRIEKKIVLIDGPRLAEYMIDFDIGVSNGAFYQVKRMDYDYFGEE